MELLGSLRSNRKRRLSQQVADELEALQVELRSPNRVNLAQEAALQPTSLKKQIGATVVAALAAFAGIGLAIGYWEFLRRRVHTPEEVSRGLGLRVIGAVPTRSIARGQGEDADQRVRESIHSIRASLLREAALQGTTFAPSWSPAPIPARARRRLPGSSPPAWPRRASEDLLVDGDLRAPTLHQLFETTAQPGLTEVLLGEVAARGRGAAHVHRWTFLSARRR